MKNNNAAAWGIRLVKGAFVGTGFILPGVSGGALAAIFGLYERMVAFLAHPAKDFRRNARFFMPVALGMAAGMVLLAYPLGFCLEHYLAPTMWFFIGAIAGTFPALWREAGKKGRGPGHIAIVAAAFAAGFAFLQFGARLFGGGVPQNFGTWVLAGALIALGVLVPGLSPSNFLLYMGMYDAMVAAIKGLDFAVLLPLALGGALCLLLFSKLVDWCFRRFYAGLFHVILGVVLASTLMIVPVNYNYLSWGALACAAALAGGVALGWWMSGLEATYKPVKA